MTRNATITHYRPTNLRHRAEATKNTNSEMESRRQLKKSSQLSLTQRDDCVTRKDSKYEGGSICNENLIITPSINALGFYVICQTKDQSVAVIMVYKTLFYLSKFNMLHVRTFQKAH